MHNIYVPTSKVRGQNRVSRSQPGIMVIIRDLRGHLLHTVTFLVLFYFSFDNIVLSRTGNQARN